MIVSLIAAMDEQYGIGWQGRLPWRLSADLRRFKSLTLGHHLIMGRKTWESIGRALPGRTSVIVTRTPDYPLGDESASLRLAGSLDAALQVAAAANDPEVFIIGGGELYAQALPLADRLYLTHVQAVVPADTFFPHFNLSDWQVIEETCMPAGEKDDYPTIFRVYRRVS